MVLVVEQRHVPVAAGLHELDRVADGLLDVEVVPGRRHQRLDRLREVDVAADEPAEDVALGQDADERPSGSVTKTESPVPVRWIARDAVAEARARRDRHRIAPADDLSRSSRTEGTRATTARSVSSVTRRSVVRLTRRAAGRPTGPHRATPGERRRPNSPALATARLGQWIAAAPLGIVLVLVSAAGIRRPGDLFAKPVYAPGSTGSAARLAVRDRGRRWRGLWLLASAAPRRGARPLTGGRSRRGRPRRLYTGNAGTYYAGPRDGAAVAGRRPRLHLPGDRRRPLRAVCDAAVRPAAMDRARDRARRGRSRAWRHRPRPAAAGLRDPAHPRLAGDLRGLDRAVGAARRRADATAWPTSRTTRRRPTTRPPPRR